MRLFVAFDFPPEVAACIRQAQQAIRQKLRVGRWQPVHNLHLTLHFLGEVEEGLVPRLAEDLNDACAGVPPFSLRLGRLGAFPGADRPRVLWLGVEGELERLFRLHARLAERFARHEAIRLDAKPFRPHITLAREPDPEGVKRLLADPSGLVREAEWRVSRIHLYRSRLLPAGAVHTILHTSTLSGAGEQSD